MTIGFSDLTSKKRVPDRVARKSAKPIYSLMSFGDGYESRVSLGTNSLEETYVLSFTNRPIEEIDSIAQFLDERSSIKNFQLTLPDNTVTLDGEKDITVYVKDYSRTYFNTEIASITVTLYREYNEADDAAGLTLVSAPYSVNEGSTLTVNVTSIGVEPQNLYWQLTDTTVFDVPILAGIFALSGTTESGTGQFDITPAADSTTEGPEVFTLSITSGGFGNLELASTTVTVQDTSRGPEFIRITDGNGIDLSLTYVQEPSTTFIYVESESSDYDVLYWTISGPSPATHFEETFGSFSMIGNVFSREGTITLNVKEIEGNTSDITYTLFIHKDSTTGPVQDNITVVITPNTYYLLVDSPGGTSANAYYFAQNKTYTVYFDTGFVNPGIYYWTIEDAATSVDFSATQGTFSTTGNTTLASGQFDLTTEVQLLAEPKNFTLRIKTGGYGGTVVDTAPITVSTSETGIYVPFNTEETIESGVYANGAIGIARYTPIPLVEEAIISVESGVTTNSKLSVVRYGVEFGAPEDEHNLESGVSSQSDLLVIRYSPAYISQEDSLNISSGVNSSSRSLNLIRY